MSKSLHLKTDGQRTNVYFTSEKEKANFIKKAEKVAMAKIGSKSLSALFKYFIANEYDKLR